MSLLSLYSSLVPRFNQLPYQNGKKLCLAFKSSDQNNYFPLQSVTGKRIRPEAKQFWKSQSSSMSVIGAFALHDTMLSNCWLDRSYSQFSEKGKMMPSAQKYLFLSGSFPRKSTSIYISLVLPADLKKKGGGGGVGMCKKHLFFFSLYFQVAASNASETLIFFYLIL